MTAAMLSSLRVLDLSGITAGGRTTQLLADHGADVIKVEGPRRPDPFRHWTGVTGESGAGDLDNPSFVVVGRGKRGVAVDLKDPRGVDVFRRLVKTADLVVENFRRGVMERLGIGFDRLLAWNPRVALLSISSQGDSGPERDYVSFGGTLEALGGLMSVTGYGPEEPVWTTSKVNFPDQLVALVAPGLALAAVMRSREQGRGIHIDLSQRETVVSLLGSQVVETSLSGRAPTPQGNAEHDELTLCLPAAGDDEWCVVSVRNATQWRRLVQELGVGEDVAIPLVGPGGWHSIDRDRAVDLLSDRTSTLSKAELMRRLQTAGLSAAEVLRASELESRAVQRGESFEADVPAPNGGLERQLSWPFLITPSPHPAVRRRAPHVGEHDCEVLLEAGLTEAAIDDLEEAGVVGIRRTSAVVAHKVEERS